MREVLNFYIGGRWVAPAQARTAEVVNPATEAPAGRISMGGAEDARAAVAAARRAFDGFARTSRAERLELLQAILAEYQRRAGELAAAVTEEMGAPAKLSQRAQVVLGAGHLKNAIDILRDYRFEEQRGTSLIVKEPIGVAALITPWNWPLNQVACKVAPALAAGCTMVLKPSEIAPFSAALFAEILDAAGVPAGVFNLVNGDGPTVGQALTSDPDVDMVSFTGSTRAGIEIARAAAPTVKRVHQELGGKSANIVLDDADLARAVALGVKVMMQNSGQSCNAPSRLLVPAARMEEALALAAQAAASVSVGDPAGGPNGGVDMGPLASKAQWDKVQRLIQAGIDEGAPLVAGGPGRPDGLERGWYARPTVFGPVRNDMTIAREEIFGPVLSVIGYDGEDEAVAIANDTAYGLAAYVQSGDPARARRVAGRLRAGQVSLNGAPVDLMAPFGGYKQSGNGREWGVEAMGEFLETKAILGCPAPQA